MYTENQYFVRNFEIYRQSNPFYVLFYRTMTPDSTSPYQIATKKVINMSQTVISFLQNGKIQQKALFFRIFYMSLTNTEYLVK